MSIAPPPALRALLSARRALVPEAEERLGNPPWAAAAARILIVRLSPWRDVDRSTSHLILFAECRKALPEAFVDFAFFPDRGDRELLEGAVARGGGAEGSPPPWFYGLASGRGPSDFDLILVSNAFALELINLPYLFSTAGVPLLASGRAAEPSPIVVLGGSNAGAAGSIVGEDGDSLVDALFFGEGEGAIGEIARILSDRGLSRADRLASAARTVEGFWPCPKSLVPRGADPAPSFDVRRRISRASPAPLLDWPILNSPESGTARLQIAAGCPGLCSFCFEGWDRRPYRELPVERVLESAREIRRRTGADTLEVYSFNFNTHAEVFALLFELGRIFKRVSFMSQRLDILATTPGLVRAELAADKRSFTLGIEGISASMRAYYRKGLAEEELDRLVDLLLVPGVRELKLFYIISGLETAADLGEFASFTERLGGERTERAPGLRILASAGYLVRLPGTPLQFAPLALEEAPLRRIAGSMEAACAAAGIEFRLAAFFDEYGADQLLALGGGAILPWLETMPAKGFIYDGSLSRGAWPSLRAFAEAKGLLVEDFRTEKTADWHAPLDFVDAGPRNRATLHAEYEEARGRRDRTACLGGPCVDCGACEDRTSRAFIAGHAIRPPDGELIDRITRLTAAKAAFLPVFVEVEIPDSLAGSTEAYKGAWLLRLLSGRCPGAESAVFEAREALFAAGERGGLGEGFVGKTLFALYGPKPAAVQAAATKAGLVLAPYKSARELPSPASLRLEVRATSGVKASTGAQATPAQALKSWLAEERIAYTERRDDDARRLEISPRDLKKGHILEASYEEGPDETIFNLTIGAKANLAEMLARLGPMAARAARVKVLSYS
ncbi:MAG: radical SAM protein [Spirochaetaceae bacterium]|nr:radical SAM protein [Spirochaetaceae bacterium]